MSRRARCRKHQVEVRAEVRVTGASGGNKITYPSTGSYLWCRVQPQKASEILAFKRKGMKTTHLVFFDSNPNLAQTNLLVFNGRWLYVESVENENEGNYLWVVSCYEGVQGIRQG